MATELAVRESSQSMLMPASLTEAMNLAKMMSDAKLVPAHLQGKPADCLLVIEQAQRWNMSPFAVAQCTSVISGKLMYEGKLVAGVINASGALSGRLSYAYSGEGANRSITVSGTFKGEAEPRTITITLAESKTQNSMWTKQPDQQLMYHGTRVWARRHAPELMLGIYAPEEMGEIIDVTPVVPAAKPMIDELRGEMERKQREMVSETSPSADDWESDMLTSPTLGGLAYKWSEAQKLFKDRPDIIERLMAAKEKRKAELMSGEGNEAVG